MDHPVIVDTDILIDFMRGKDEAMNSLQKIEQETSVSISVITQMELFIGCCNKKELRDIEKFLSRFRIVGLNEEISGYAADLLRHYHLSHGLLIADALISATAIQYNSLLLSKNQKDYRFINELKLLPYPLLSDKKS